MKVSGTTSSALALSVQKHSAYLCRAAAWLRYSWQAEARRRVLLALAANIAVPAIVGACVIFKPAAPHPAAAESQAPALVARRATAVPLSVLMKLSPGQAATPLQAASRWAAADRQRQAGDRDRQRGILPVAQYDPQVLAGLSAAQIAGQLQNPSSPVAKAIDGSARVIVAAIDQVLHDGTSRPARVSEQTALPGDG